MGGRVGSALVERDRVIIEQGEHQVGAQPGKQPGPASFSHGLVDDPDERLDIHPDRCGSCAASLRRAGEHSHQRRQIVVLTDDHQRDIAAEHRDLEDFALARDADAAVGVWWRTSNARPAS